MIKAAPIEVSLTDADRKLLKAGEGLVEIVAGRNDEIHVNGRSVGKGPSVKLPLQAGVRHEVRVKMRGARGRCVGRTGRLRALHTTSPGEASV